MYGLIHIKDKTKDVRAKFAKKSMNSLQQPFADSKASSAHSAGEKDVGISLSEPISAILNIVVAHQAARRSLGSRVYLQ